MSEADRNDRFDGIEVVAPRGLPAEIETLFVTALAALDDAGRIDTLLADSFTVDPDEPAGGRDARLALRSRLRSSDAYPALGVAYLLRQLVAAFRDRVEQWYLDDRRRTAGPADELQLDAVCRTYRGIFEYLPTFRIDDLDTLTGRRTGAGTGSAFDARQVLIELPDQVRDAVLVAVGADRRRHAATLPWPEAIS